MADAKKDYVDEFLENEDVRRDNFSEDTQPTAGFELIAFPLNAGVADEPTDADLIDDEPATISDHLFYKLALGGHDGTQRTFQALTIAATQRANRSET